MRPDIANRGAITTMSGLPITFACGLYDRMLALHTGEVKPDGIDLNFLAIDHPREIFDRMANNLEFDAAEMSTLRDKVRADYERQTDPPPQSDGRPRAYSGAPAGVNAPGSPGLHRAARPATARIASRNSSTAVRA